MATQTQKYPSLIEIKEMFDKINKEVDPELFVDFSDTEYYADQLENIYEIDSITASGIAEELYAMELAK